MKKKFLLALMSFLLWISPNSIYAQAPTLGAATGFAVFTTTGAIGNTGTTNVWGDVGSNSTSSSTGSSITLVVGSTHYSDATSSTATTDVGTAYSYLSGLSCDSSISTTFGGGLVLVPGRVYCLAAASTLTGNLILDAKGNSSAIFNFKIAGSLTTSTSSRVILKNGASFCNVYWQIGGAVSLGKNSIFRGTMLVDGAIELLDYDTLEGRALSKPGAITLSNNKVVGCDASGQPLPVELISFIVKPSGSSAEIYWVTASETNNDYFTVERSNDGIAFEKVIQKPGAGNSSMILHYSAIDYNPYDGISFYRLKQTDYDGKISYSNVIAFHSLKSDKFNVYPNPFNSTINIAIGDETNFNNCKLILYNVLSEKLKKIEITNQLTSIQSGLFSSGVYYYKVIENGRIIQTGKLISLN